MSRGAIAIIAGSGFDDALGEVLATRAETRFGLASGPIRRWGSNAAVPFVAMARHGDGHTIAPHRINYRANLLALQRYGVDSVIALCTSGVIRGVCQPGDIAVPAQILDYTWGRPHTIFDDGNRVQHIDFSEPFSEPLRRMLLAASGNAGVACHDGGVYAATQGPRLETAAEIDRLEHDGADFVGMTGMPEAAIARELGLGYAILALIVNFAAGRSDRPIHDEVESSTLAAKTATTRLIDHLPHEPCDAKPGTDHERD